MTSELHEDFRHLQVTPGAAHIVRDHEKFDLRNVVLFGGATDHPTHVPTELGSVGSVVIWESTGAADSLPFWNTNFRADSYLYVVDGAVRVDFKEPEGSTHYGHYEARTGDLFRMPKSIAHRTSSLDGKRRISLEVLERDPAWDTLGRHADVAPNRSLVLGGFSVELGSDRATITCSDGQATVPLDSFVRGLRALVAWEAHLGHNEFDGGLVVADHGDTVELKIAGHSENVPTADFLALGKGTLEQVAG